DIAARPGGDGRTRRPRPAGHGSTAGCPERSLAAHTAGLHLPAGGAFTARGRARARRQPGAGHGGTGRRWATPAGAGRYLGGSPRDRRDDDGPGHLRAPGGPAPGLARVGGRCEPPPGSGPGVADRGPGDLATAATARGMGPEVLRADGPVVLGAVPAVLGHRRFRRPERAGEPVRGGGRRFPTGQPAACGRTHGTDDPLALPAHLT